MKTRIISGIVMILIVAAVLALGFTVSGWFITVFIALAAAGAVFELLKNAFGIKSKTALIGACVYSVLMIFALDSVVSARFQTLCNIEFSAETRYGASMEYSLAAGISVLYFIFAAVCCLALHKYFTTAHIAALCAFPLPIAYAFSALGALVSHENGLYYLLLLLNFSSVCDMGAYFVGSTMGRHKLCPNISPKKTVEGAAGGIVSALIVSVIIVLSFSASERLVPVLIITVPFCILGMIGDLFASVIKRAAGIKDYGRLIPGHGGVLDRVDSILMTAPLLYLLVCAGVI